MDPVVTTLVSAFVLGAASGANKVADKAIADAYAALKTLVTTAYHHAADLLSAVTGLESKPDSAARRDTVAEELKASGAINDEKLLAAAESVIAAAERTGAGPAIGVDWQDVKAARLKIGEIRGRAGAIGFRAARMEITGEIEIPKIDVAGHPAK